MNLYKAFFDTAIRYSERPCITDSHGTWTYRELLQQIERYQVFLQTQYSHLAQKQPTLINSDSLLISEGSTIFEMRKPCAFLYLPKCRELIAWQLALNSFGIVFVTLDFSQPARSSQAFTQLKPALFITVDSFFSDSRLPLPPNASSEFQQHLILYFNSHRIDHKGTHLFFSSGSTGEPKGIYLDDAPVVQVVQQQAIITKTTQESVFLWVLNPAFDASLSDIFVPLLHGAHLIVSPFKAFELNKLIPLVQQHQVTHVDLPPSVFSIWLRGFESQKLPSIRHVIFGGELASLKLVQRLQSYCNLYNAYGPTESSVCTSLIPVNASWEPSLIGLPLDGVLYRLVDGELHIGGAHLSLGYDNPALNNRFYSDVHGRWFRSGDLMSQNTQGMYCYHGRIDRQFKHHGQLICPEEIESAALRSGAVRAQVLYQNSKIILRHQGSFDRHRFSELLPSWMLPHFEESVTQLDAFNKGV